MIALLIGIVAGYFIRPLVETKVNEIVAVLKKSNK